MKPLMMMKVGVDALPRDAALGKGRHDNRLGRPLADAVEVHRDTTEIVACLVIFHWSCGFVR